MNASRLLTLGSKSELPVFQMMEVDFIFQWQVLLNWRRQMRLVQLKERKKERIKAKYRCIFSEV